jgi:hypothetical protein
MAYCGRARFRERVATPLQSPVPVTVPTLKVPENAACGTTSDWNEAVPPVTVEQLMDESVAVGPLMELT